MHVLAYKQTDFIIMNFKIQLYIIFRRNYVQYQEH